MKNKMTYRLLLTLFALSTLFACKKETRAISSNELYNIRGTALYTDYYLNNSASLPFSNKRVFIRADTSGSLDDTSNYFYSVITQADGGFNFYVADTSIRYKIFTTAVLKSSASFSPSYYGSVITGTPFGNNINLQLNVSADTVKGNGLSVITSDVNGEIIPLADVIFYASRIIAIADSSCSGTGSIYKLKTDSAGKGFISNLPAGNVYINALLSLTDSTSLKKLVSTLLIKEHTIAADTLKLE